MSASAHIADITRIIQGKPAAPMAELPPVWQQAASHAGTFACPAKSTQNYVEAAQLFRHHGTPMAMEALSAIGNNLRPNAYPNFAEMAAEAQTALQRKTVAACEDVYHTFGPTMPATFYTLLVEIAFRDNTTVMMDLFKDEKKEMHDRLADAVLHAVLLVTPIGMHVHSILSKHGLRFAHVMNCGCITAETDAPAFDYPLDANLQDAYMQNVIAASFEQYGVNAATSGVSRGF